MSNVLLVDGDNLLTIGFHGLKNHYYQKEFSRTNAENP
jgi:hypothetical protein